MRLTEQGGSKGEVGCWHCGRVMLWMFLAVVQMLMRQE